MIVHLISSPRTISTALMYSFYNRDDFDAVDEPLYAYYLNKTGKNHPGTHGIIRSQSLDVEQVFKQIKTSEKPHVFVKNMASHLVGINLKLYSKFNNIILFRDPGRIIQSFSQVIQEFKLEDIGIKFLHDVFFMLKSEDCIAINSDNLLIDPERNLRILCDQLNIDMSPNMLTWPSGPKKIDGVWAQYWYSNAHKSTGFISKQPSEYKLPQSLLPLYDEAISYYNELSKHSII